ncbi:uncharacterized protein METZ01_LOCUS340838 [marine metagenome]|uniref:Uncharacterized protein n=1 Tax=marine metagenome TaxID=408172 RepID=A0A382QR31_9ZZZZ
MATVITNKDQTSIVSATTTDGAVTLAEMTKSGETVTTANIVEIFWTVNGTNTWLVDRGGTAIGQFSGSGHWDLTSSGISLATGNTADIGLTLSGGTGYIIVKVHKLP